MVLGALITRQNNPGEAIGAGFGAGLGQSLTTQYQNYSDNKKMKQLSTQWDKDTPMEQKFMDIAGSGISDQAMQKYLGIYSTLGSLQKATEEMNLKKQVMQMLNAPYEQQQAQQTQQQPQQRSAYRTTGTPSQVQYEATGAPLGDLSVQIQNQNRNPLDNLKGQPDAYAAAHNMLNEGRLALGQQKTQQSTMPRVPGQPQPQTQVQQPQPRLEAVIPEQIQKPQYKQRPYSPQVINGLISVDANAGRAAMLANESVDRENKFLLEQYKTDLKTQETNKKMVSESYQATKDYRNTLNTSYKAHLEDKSIYNRMKQLNEKNLASPVQAMISEHFNVPISVLSNPQSEEFEKLVATMTRSVKQYYGSRITNLDLEMFLKGIPTLKNSKEGRQRIIETLEKLDKPKELEYKAYQEIKKEYKDQPLPFDLQEQVIERIEPELDNLSKEIKNSIEETSIEPVKKGTPITKDVAEKILKKANGDPIEARKLAKELGYGF